MLEHPSRRYVAFLCTKSSHTAKDILVLLMRKGLPVPRDSESREWEELLADVRREMLELRLPAQFDPREGSATEEESVQFLRTHGILGAWRDDRFVTAAFRALERPQLSRMLQVLLLSPLQPSHIARRCRDRFDMNESEMCSRVVRSYSHYFWDTEALNTAKWNIMLSRWFAGSSVDMQLSLNAPRSEVGAALAIAAADRGVTASLPEIGMFRYVRDAAFMEFTKTVVDARPGLSKSTSMLQYTQTMIAAQAELDARRGGSAELLDELRRIEAEYDQESISTLADLSRPSDYAVIDTVGEEK